MSPRRSLRRGAALAAALVASALPALPSSAGAQFTRPGGVLAPAPAARPAAPRAVRADTNTTSYEVAGIRVIHRRASNDVVAANLYLLGGTREVTAQTAGLEPFLLELSERGTASYSKAALRTTMARLGTSIVVDAEHDWTMFGARATVATFDSTWAVLADRLMRPTLDPKELEQVRAQYLSAVAQRKDSPEALLNHLADSIAFPGHPYTIDPVGSEASVAAFTPAQLRRFQQERMVTSRMLLVVVGNVERATVERLVSRTLGTLPRGSYAWTPPPPLPMAGTAHVVSARQLPTNYILGYFAGPPANSRDYAALRIATAVLSGRLFNEIRVQRNLTYEVSAPFVERAVGAGGLYVTTAYPDSTLGLMRAVVEEVKQGTVTAYGLEQLVQQFITGYFLDNETNADQADFLAQAQLYHGDWRHADRFVDELRSVTPEDIRRVANQYVKGVRFAYVGDPGKVPARWFETF